MRACRRGIWAAGLFSLALNLLMLTVPLYMTSIYDRVLSSGSTETLLMLTIVAVGALGAVGILEIIRQIVLTRIGARLETVLGEPLLDASLRLARHGGPDAQGLRDLAQVRQFVSSPLISALFDAPIAPLYIALVYLVHPHLGWLTFGMAILLLAISILNQQVTRAPLAEASRHSMAALHEVQSQIRNAEIIRTMGMSSNATAGWGRENAQALIASDKAARRSAFLTGISRFLRLLLQIAVLGYGAYLVLADNSISAGIIFAASIISARALAPLDQAIGGWRSFVSALQSWRRLKGLLASAPSGREPMALPEPSARLSAEKLVYMPAPGSEPILKGLSFAIEPGEVVGIIGPSGAGKSTLARLLVGALTPTAGLVRIGGDDLQHWSPEALGPFIGYVPQDVELFPATVAQNIARLDAAPDPEKVVAAAKLANCHELIQRLPGGYDTLLGPQGHALSGGQRQRVALARAFYGRPKLVVLDEPNASLDSDGEQALITALIEARKTGITCVVITQRTSVVPALTKVMVLREGRIEAYGPKEEVLQSQIRQAAPAQAPAAPSGDFAATGRFG
jgi:ATP-binding cassette subfamily C protein